MDYNQRSRGQKSGAGHPARAPRRSVSSRMGLEKRGAPAQQPPRGNAPRPNQQRGPIQPPRSGQPPRQNRPGQNQPNNGRRPRPQQQPAAASELFQPLSTNCRFMVSQAAAQQIAAKVFACDARQMRSQWSASRCGDLSPDSFCPGNYSRKIHHLT